MGGGRPDIAGLDVKAFASRDEEEVAGYADVMETVFAHWQKMPLSENHIKQLHRDLLFARQAISVGDVQEGLAISDD